LSSKHKFKPHYQQQQQKVSWPQIDL
jgi:hypothetical protein